MYLSVRSPVRDCPCLFNLFFLPVLLCAFLPSHFHYLSLPHFLIAFQFILSARSPFPFLLLFPFFLHSCSPRPLLFFSSPASPTHTPPPPLTLLWNRESWVGRQQQLQKEQLLYVRVCVWVCVHATACPLHQAAWAGLVPAGYHNPAKNPPTSQAHVCSYARTHIHMCTNTSCRHKNHMHSHIQRNFTDAFIFKCTPFQWESLWIIQLWALVKCMEIYAHSFSKSSIPLQSLWQRMQFRNILCTM